MAQKADGLFTDYLRERWTARSAPALGATAVASASGSGGTGLVANTIGSKERYVIESMIVSCANNGAAAVTVTAEVRAASIGGAVIANWDVIIAASGSYQDCFAQLNFPAPRGQDLVVDVTASASVTSKVAAAGWIERSQTD